MRAHAASVSSNAAEEDVVDQVRIDTSDVKQLAASIDQAVDITPREVRGVVQKGALNIKRGAQERIGRGPYLPGYASTISYDTTVDREDVVEAEIGPDKNKRLGGGEYRTPGNLGNILEYGSPGRAPKPHLGPAAEDEAPRFERALEDVVVKALGL
jgi:hypothetical protein